MLKGAVPKVAVSSSVCGKCRVRMGVSEKEMKFRGESMHESCVVALIVSAIRVFEPEFRSTNLRFLRRKVQELSQVVMTELKAEGAVFDVALGQLKREIEDLDDQPDNAAKRARMATIRLQIEKLEAFGLFRDALVQIFGLDLAAVSRPVTTASESGEQAVA